VNGVELEQVRGRGRATCDLVDVSEGEIATVPPHSHREPSDPPEPVDPDPRCRHLCDTVRAGPVSMW
jgi:hypothetical protein